MVGCKVLMVRPAVRSTTKSGPVRGRRFLMNSTADEVGGGHLAAGNAEPMLLVPMNERRECKVGTA